MKTGRVPVPLEKEPLSFIGYLIMSVNKFKKYAKLNWRKMCC